MTAFVPAATNHIPLFNQLQTRNVLLNPGFVVNQMGYVSAAALAVGIYGHDGWKAGAAGGDYSFVQGKSTTGITIAAAKTLIQVIEDIHVEGGQYILSWTGTAQARVGINTAVPAGVYANSPIVIAGQTAGTVMSVEFNTGTLSKPKLELGTADPTDYNELGYDLELPRCQRQYERINYDAANLVLGIARISSATTASMVIRHAVRKRAIPAFSSSAAANFILQNSAGNTAVTALAGSNFGLDTAQLDITVAAGLTNGQAGELINTNAGTFIAFDCRL